MIKKFLRKTGLTREREYRQHYPDEFHEKLVNFDEIINDEYSLNKQYYSIDLIKKMEKDHPTHWFWKYVTDPIEMNFRGIALIKSMAGKYDSCIAICQNGLEKYPDSPYLLYLLGRTYGDRQNYEEGLIALNRLLDLYPDFADAFLERGSIKGGLGYIEDCLIDLKYAKTLEPDIILPNFSVECALCKACISENDEYSIIYPGAEKGSFDLTPPQVICKKCADGKFSQNIEDEPDQFAKIVIAMNKGNFLVAFDILTSIFNKENPSHWYNAGNILVNLKRFDEAYQCYDNAIFLNTHYTKCWYRKGSLLSYKQDYASAVKAFDNVIQLDPNNVYNWGHAAMLNSMLCSVIMNNSAINEGKGSKELSQLILKKIKFLQYILENKRLKREDGSIQKIIPDNLNIDDFVDYCIENQGELLNLLENQAIVEIKTI